MTQRVRHSFGKIDCMHAQEILGVPKDIVYESCSDKVGDALGPDVMKSVKHLIPDILAALPLLLYQGRFLTPALGA